MKFELQYTDPRSNARAGLITTDHGQIETPIFMPVGTLGSVKAVHLHEQTLRHKLFWEIPIICTFVPDLTHWKKPVDYINSTASTVRC